ncbi:MAG: hypothetical protein IKA74_04890 [Clostridia bacterium]|nr:hypothetical protein [Clostridia bacterium]
MKDIGVKKSIDNLGRICIPKEMRELLKLEEKVEVVLTTDGILIRNPDYVLIERSKAILLK